MKCATCGTESDGNFCPSCGTSLGGGHCAHCGGRLVAGARFCTQCGTATGQAGPAPDHGSNLPWYLGAGVLILLIVILALPALTGNGGSGATADPGPNPNAPFATPGAPAGTGTPPPLTGTPREQADRLFNRIMQARSAEDTATVAFFTPMAVQAYEAVRPLDHDGLFHLAAIHTAAGDHASARSVAGEILAADPDHLLGLAISADAALAAGDDDAARQHFGRYIDVYDAQVARQLTEYQDHAALLPDYLATARSVTGR